MRKFNITGVKFNEETRKYELELVNGQQFDAATLQALRKAYDTEVESEGVKPIFAVIRTNEKKQTVICRISETNILLVFPKYVFNQKLHCTSPTWEYALCDMLGVPVVE